MRAGFFCHGSVGASRKRPPVFPVIDHNLCTELEIARLVRDFYARVRVDERLGPIFNAHIGDWDAHLVKLTAFWSSILRGTARYSGAPMPRHAALPGLDAALFERWLALFHETAREQPNQAMAARAYQAAQRIARSLWFGYQTSREPSGIASDLSPAGPVWASASG